MASADEIKTAFARSSLAVPRGISSASKIPVLPRGHSRDVRLIHPEGTVFSTSNRFITTRKTGSYISRSDDVPLDAFAEILPRMAHSFVTPEFIDLIPSSSWFASLANILVTSSWNDIRGKSVSAWQGCQDCGSPVKLEAHEIWDYDDQTKVQRLSDIRCLCNLCHGTQHIGRANSIGNFDATFRRLCLINRIAPYEEKLYRDLIFDKFVERSQHAWKLDFSGFFDDNKQLRLKTAIVYVGENWIHQPALSYKDEMNVEIIGADIVTDGTRLLLIKQGTGPTL